MFRIFETMAPHQQQPQTQNQGGWGGNQANQNQGGWGGNQGGQNQGGWNQPTNQGNWGGQQGGYGQQGSGFGY